MKEIAYGPLNLSPEELGVLTYGELMDLFKGYNWRERRQMEHNAQLAAWIMSPHTKKPIDPKDLLAPEKPKRIVTKEEKERVTREIEERLGVR